MLDLLCVCLWLFPWLWKGCDNEPKEFEILTFLVILVKKLGRMGIYM